MVSKATARLRAHNYQVQNQNHGQTSKDENQDLQNVALNVLIGPRPGLADNVGLHLRLNYVKRLRSKSQNMQCTTVFFDKS